MASRPKRAPPRITGARLSWTKSSCPTQLASFQSRLIQEKQPRYYVSWDISLSASIQALSFLSW